jgi:hypothetical protein
MVSMGYVVLGKVYSVTTWLEELALLLAVLIQDCCHDVAATTLINSTYFYLSETLGSDMGPLY